MTPAALDPRTKLFLALAGAVWVIAAATLRELAFQYAALLALTLLGGLARDYLRWLRLVLPMALFFAAVTAWSAGLSPAAAAGLKLVALTTVFFLFFAATLPEDLANALVKAGVPYSAAFVVSAALQFVPVLGRKARGVLDAQRARGLPLEPGWAALKHYPAFLGPLLIQAFELAENLAQAMEARGFGRPGRTFLIDYRLQYRDWLCMAAALALLCARFGWRTP